MAKTYRTVLFDADNTLFDFDAAEDQALRRTMEKRGLPFTREAKAAYLEINRPLWDALHRGEVTQGWLTVERFRRFGAWCGAEEDPVRWDEEYLDLLGECPALLPGARALLETLAPRCQLALATNGVTRVQKRRLAQSGLEGYFQGVYISQEMGARKPQREYFQRALADLGADPEESVMVGDNLLSDIQGAKNGGLDSIWYAPGGERSELATYVVDKLSDIPAIVLGERER